MWVSLYFLQTFYGNGCRIKADYGTIQMIVKRFIRHCLSETKEEEGAPR